MTKIDLTKPVQTKSGRNVEVFNTNRGIIIGFIEGDSELFSWDPMGQLSNGAPDSSGNLVNPPKPTEPPKWRPYRDGEVKLGDQFKHRGKKLMIMVIALYDNHICAAHREIDYAGLLADWLKLDGTPAGVLVEENNEN